VSLPSGWRAISIRQAPPGGESASQLRERIIAFLADVAEKHANQTTVIVTHGGPCKYAVAHVLGISPTGVYRYAIDNSSITTIEIGVAGWRLVTLNDTCHLREVDQLSS